MASPRSLLFLFVVLAVSTHLSKAQHWSHGWYPGGKREIDLPHTPEASEEIESCSGEECTYLRSPRKTILNTLLADLLARRLQKKK
uniref:Progonadoliberin n=1 Tax=Sphenodon punctatus TaxID=8508 RepID=A0A8D0GZK5_SPHPU